ncbi:MAG: zinc-binding dehydrogenase [Acidimicrobiales bacterium]
MLGHVTDPAEPGGLARRELPEPSPRANEIVVEVRAYGVNRGELSLLARRPNGWMPGQDVAGVVAVEARDGSGPAAGSRVVALADQGGWSERVAVPTHRVARLPAEVTFSQAAALPVAGLTAIRALRTGGPLLGGQVLVTGASGGVGHFAVQLARIGGAVVTALVSGPPRVAGVKSLGADHVVTVLDGTGPFDLVLDGVGGTVLLDAIHRVRAGGTIAAYGLASGQPTKLTFGDFGGAPLARLIGFFVYATGEETFGVDLGVLAGYVADGRLHVETGVHRDWVGTLDAVEELRARRVTGKAVLTLGWPRPDPGLTTA